MTTLCGSAGRDRCGRKSVCVCVIQIFGIGLNGNVGF